MEIKIREMAIEDIDDILVIEHESFSVPWPREAFESEVLRNAISVYIVAETEGEIIGYGGMWLILDEAHITNVAVKESLRGNGVGERLAQFLIDEASKSGAISMTLEVRKGNAAAISLYEKMEFVVEGIRPGYYQDNKEDALIMWKRGGK
ncbi:MAG: ribosomal protein S18-alanine N-acetyltransferase [Peptostreptococcaceae bacterium]|nr:ribosomal protein S18-alanine N-acetyltransferase [Peptostreptococcaceae bacterium]